MEDEPKPDIKKSSARKATAFLQRYSDLRAGQGEGDEPLLGVSTEENGVSSVVRVNRSHHLFRCPTGDVGGSTGDTTGSQRSLQALQRIMESVSLTDHSYSSEIIFFKRVSEHAYRVADADAFRARLRLDDSGQPISLSTLGVDANAVAASAVASSGSIMASQGKRGKMGTAIKVAELYKFPRPFRDMLGCSVKGEFGEYLSASEVKELLLFNPPLLYTNTSMFYLRLETPCYLTSQIAIFRLLVGVQV